MKTYKELEKELDKLNVLDVKNIKECAKSLLLYKGEKAETPYDAIISTMVDRNTLEYLSDLEIKILMERSKSSEKDQTIYDSLIKAIDKLRRYVGREF